MTTFFAKVSYGKASFSPDSVKILTATMPCKEFNTPETCGDNLVRGGRPALLAGAVLLSAACLCFSRRLFLGLHVYFFLCFGSFCLRRPIGLGRAGRLPLSEGNILARRSWTALLPCGCLPSDGGAAAAKPASCRLFRPPGLATNVGPHATLPARPPRPAPPRPSQPVPDYIVSHWPSFGFGAPLSDFRHVAAFLPTPPCDAGFAIAYIPGITSAYPYFFYGVRGNAHTNNAWKRAHT